MLLSRSRLEPDPWRLVWKCTACGEASAVRVTDEARLWLLGLLHAGGLAVGAFEADAFEAADPATVTAAAAAELW